MLDMTRSRHSGADRFGKRQNAPALTSFFLSDSSPMFHYSGINPSAWNTGYALQSDGWDSTVHLASQSGAAITFDITATSLTLLIPSFANCTSTLSLNGSAPVPACPTSASGITLQNLPRGIHQLQYTFNALQTGQEVSFWGVDGTRPYDGPSWGNVTIDSARKGGPGAELKYVGDWTMEEGVSGAGNRTLAGTGGKGSAVEFTGKGSAIYLYGNTGPGYSSASISLDDAIVDLSLNFSATWSSTYQLLWFRTGLDPSRESKVVMTNLEDKRMALDFVVLTPSQDEIALLSNTAQPFLSTLAGKIVTFAVIPFLALILLGLAIFFLVRRRRRSTCRRASAGSTSTHKALRHHESMQSFPASHLDYGRDALSAHSGMAEKDYYAPEPPGSRYSLQPPLSARSMGEDGMVTYEEGLKRLSATERDRNRRSALTSYPHSALSGQDGSDALYSAGLTLGLPSAAYSPFGFAVDKTASRPGSDAPSPRRGSAQSSFLKPFHFLLGQPSPSPVSPTLGSIPDEKEGDIGMSVTSPFSVGSPTSVSAAELAYWSKATATRANIQSTTSHYPSDPGFSPLFSSSLPLSDRDRSEGDAHPFARFRPSDGPSGRTSISFSDVLSVVAAPPSVRDLEYGDMQSVHTGRSAPTDHIFRPEPDAPAVPAAVYGAGADIPGKSGTQPLRLGSRPPPSAFPAEMPRAISTRRKPSPALAPPGLSPITASPLFQYDATTPSPARPESATHPSPLPSPSESVRLQQQYTSYTEGVRSRYLSDTSHSSAYTAASAARPDSEVIPFEEFVAGLKDGHRRAQEDREKERMQSGAPGPSSPRGEGARGGRV
ncbi:uncharacterized protein MKK02DRAFT_45549 [Dioszegia hungarica]|uniref:Uncharacterized protein n=1 Tax=Dioszegia hungarica TaxID=4972 RepID=A0AA38H925_9TREE|nr:uncharacterized protein MKK02DRAFT_45549 [Dioszegia hungarica]KAI9636842.1 hypothetical protein MKK02DRAFT_45549 [Dioszegia hungarica]